MFHSDSSTQPSPMEDVLSELERIDPKWRIEIGEPGALSG